MKAEDVGITGYEDRDWLDAASDLKARIEAIRLIVGPMMNLGDVTSKSVPKMMLVAPPRNGGAITVRSFIPHRAHATIGVLGAVFGDQVARHVGWRSAFFIGGGMGLALLALRVSVVESGLFNTLRARENPAAPGAAPHSTAVRPAIRRGDFLAHQCVDLQERRAKDAWHRARVAVAQQPRRFAEQRHATLCDLRWRRGDRRCLRGGHRRAQSAEPSATKLERYCCTRST
jgi:hypothetical protein